MFLKMEKFTSWIQWRLVRICSGGAALRLGHTKVGLAAVFHNISSSW